MDLIVLGKKTYEFRKVLYPSTVRRICFYETSPISSIRHTCAIGPPVIRPTLPLSIPPPCPDKLLPEDGSTGNTDFNARAKDYEGYDYAYPTLGCWKLKDPMSFADMREKYGFKGAPRGMIYVKEDMRVVICVEDQIKMW